MMEEECFTANDEELLKLVEKSPQLWKKNEKCFRNKAARENAWVRIAAILDQTDVQCKRRFSTLRNRYATIKRKKRFTSSAPDADSMETVWPLSLMRFLDPYIAARKRQGNVKPSVKTDQTTTAIKTEIKILDENQDGSENGHPLKTTIYVNTDEINDQHDSSRESASTIFDPFYQVSKLPACSSSNSTPSLSSTPSSSNGAEQKTGVLSAEMCKRRKLSTVDNSALSSLTKMTTDCMDSLKVFLNTQLQKSEEMDVEKSFACMIAAILKEIKNKRRRKRAMNEILILAMSFDSGSDDST